MAATSRKRAGKLSDMAARAQFLLGKVMTLAGKPKEAASHYQEAARICSQA
jgi:TolA-binding protein